MFHQLHRTGAHAMDKVVTTINIAVLLIMWEVNKFFENCFSYSKRAKRKASSRNLEQNRQVYSGQRKPLKKETKLLFNPLSKVPSYLTISDLISPMEEEMLRCICAKGYSKADELQVEAPTATTDKQIPRATFTAIWIESCAR